MKKIEKKDLIDNEIYICFIKSLNIKYLIKKTNNFICTNIEILPLNKYFFKYGAFNDINNEFYEATPEEKHWLEVCIVADSFISYEEAMKSFIPEYVECITSRNDRFIQNKIYKVLSYKNIDEPRINLDNKGYYHFLPFNGGFWKFKPSTKEAYDAQFVVKEPEFVLPEKWCINRENNPIIIDWCNKNSTCNRTDYDKQMLGWFFHFPSYGSRCHTWNICKCDYKEIIFDQFKKYVLKEQLEEPKDKVLKQLNTYSEDTILKVESSEGAVFELGDKITVFTKDSLNKGKILTIKGFRWNNAKTNLCALTEIHGKNGIGLDKIELYLEPKQIVITKSTKDMLELASQGIDAIQVNSELSLLEQAKLKYPIGTKVKSLITGHICIITQQSYINLRNSDGYCKNTDSIWFTASPYSPLIYRKGQWAEIIEDFKLPETWWITIENERQLKIAKQYAGKLFTFNNDLKIGSSIAYCVGLNLILGNYKNISNITKSRNPQITFEQFEQHVLHNGFKVGDRFNKQKYLHNINIITEVDEKEIIDLQYINNQSVAFYKIVENGHTAPYCRILTKNIVR